jgi:hypothetical protein
VSSELLLLKAIRSGRLADVQAALAAGAPAELADGQGDPGLPMGIACFMGFGDIVRELVKHGGKVNLGDNRLPTSPLSMALRGGRTEVFRTLVELGAEVPTGMSGGLTEQELTLAQWKAQRDGYLVGSAESGVDEAPVIEEIEAQSCFGTDTQVLEADVLRAVRESR